MLYCTKKNQYTLCTGFSFCLHNGRGSNKAAAHSAASNQPSGLLLRVTGCGSQHPPRALGGTCVLLAAAPKTPPCIGHRPQSSLLQVPMVRNVYRGSCGSKDFMAFLFCKPWLHGFCTVFARSVLSMSDDVGRCIALQSVPFFASGEQCQAKFCLHFRFEGFFLDLAWIEPPFSPRATAGQPPAEGRQFTLGTFGKAGIIPVSLHLADPHIGQSGLKDIARLAVLHAAAASGAGSRQIVPCGTICPHQGGQRQGSVPEERALLPLPEAESGQRARPRRHGQDFAVGGGAPAYGC